MSLLSTAVNAGGGEREGETHFTYLKKFWVIYLVERCILMNNVPVLVREAQSHIVRGSHGAGFNQQWDASREIN